MRNINLANFEKDMSGIVKQAIQYNEPVHINTKDGNAVLLSEEEYNGLVETVYLSSVPGMRDTIAKGLQTPLSECVPENEVEW